MSDRPPSSPNRLRVLWAVSAGFWLFVCAISAAQVIWISRTPGQQINLRGALVWQTAYLAAWIPVTVGVWRVTRGWLPDQFTSWIRYLLAHLPVMAAVAIVHPILVTALALALGPAQGMSPWARFVSQLRQEMSALTLIYVAIVGTGAAMTLYDRYRDRRIAAARLEAELAAARLQVLRGHLQPHFLFNSLHTVASLARAGDNAGVVRLVAALSDVLRQVLDAGDRHASLRDELEIVERYLEIQRARFPDRLQVRVDVADDVAAARVPLFIVQPLVENAVRHGLAPRVREGSLVIRAVHHNGSTRIDVEDTGVGLPPGWTMQTASGTGLRNLASRLAAEFGDAAALEVSARQGGGVRATVTLPYVPS
jgi:two-component system, LytTR family, sensor kinase